MGRGRARLRLLSSLDTVMVKQPDQAKMRENVKAFLKRATCREDKTLSLCVYINTKTAFCPIGVPLIYANIHVNYIL